MDEILSLKWNNHSSSLLKVLGLVKKKEKYSDVTLACLGKFYYVHKIVLSTCSTYFEEIFDQAEEKNVVIVLTNISSVELEQLLDYMYIGEMHVKQANISSLLKAAECLRIKGLAVPDDIDAPRNSSMGASNTEISQERTRKRKEPDTRDCDDLESFYRSQKYSKHRIYTASEVKTEYDLPSKADTGPTLVRSESITNRSEKAVTPNGFRTECGLEYAAYNPTQMNSKPAIPQRILSSLEMCMEEGYPFSTTSLQNKPSQWPSEDSSSSCSKDHIAIPGKDPQNKPSQWPSEDSSSSYSKDPLAIPAKDPQKDCEICGLPTTGPFALENHLRTHTGEKPFICRICAYRCSQKGNLKRHMLTMHGDSALY